MVMLAEKDVKRDPTPDVFSDFNIMAGSLPRGSVRRALDAEIAGEGQKVLGEKGDKIILSDGTQVAWTPPPEKLVIPDLSEVKSLRHYFGARGYQVYPAWLYHPSKAAVLVKDHAEAAQYGVVHRQATVDERNRYGLKHVWDWEEGSDWRPNPYREAAFDPKNPGTGKVLVSSAPDPGIAQNSMIARLIPEVAAAVTQALKVQGPAAPTNVDSAQWEQFLAFQAWQKTQEVVADLASGSEAAGGGLGDQTDAAATTNALSPETDRFLWEAEATRLGVEVDKRWGLKRLREEVEKAQAAESGDAGGAAS